MAARRKRLERFSFAGILDIGFVHPDARLIRYPAKDGFEFAARCVPARGAVGINYPANLAGLQRGL